MKVFIIVPLSFGSESQCGSCRVGFFFGLVLRIVCVWAAIIFKQFSFCYSNLISRNICISVLFFVCVCDDDVLAIESDFKTLISGICWGEPFFIVFNAWPAIATRAGTAIYSQDQELGINKLVRNIIVDRETIRKDYKSSNIKRM